MIKDILKELQSYKRNKNDLLAIYIDARLNQCLKCYEYEINNAYKEVHNRNNIKILKILSRK